MTDPVVQGRRGVLDTNTLIMMSRLTDTSSLPHEPLITAVTLAELSVGPLVASTDAERAARQAHLQQAEADFDPLPFDALAARAFGRVAASLRRARRKTNARAYDAMIAATAIANGLPVCIPAIRTASLASQAFKSSQYQFPRYPSAASTPPDVTRGSWRPQPSRVNVPRRILEGNPQERATDFQGAPSNHRAGSPRRFDRACDARSATIREGYAELPDG